MRLGYTLQLQRRPTIGKGGDSSTDRPNEQPPPQSTATTPPLQMPNQSLSTWLKCTSSKPTSWGTCKPSSHRQLGLKLATYRVTQAMTTRPTTRPMQIPAAKTRPLAAQSTWRIPCVLSTKWGVSQSSQSSLRGHQDPPQSIFLRGNPRHQGTW